MGDVEDHLKDEMIFLFNFEEYSTLIFTRIFSVIKFFKKNCFLLGFTGVCLEDTMTNTWDLQRGKFVRKLFEMTDSGCMRSIPRRWFLIEELGEWSSVRDNLRNKISHIIYKAKELLDLLDRCQFVGKIL